MRAVEMYYTPAQLSLLVGLHVKTVLEKVRLGEIRRAVNVGGEGRAADYRVPASAVNEWLEQRQVHREIGTRACSVRELRRKVCA